MTLKQKLLEMINRVDQDQVDHLIIAESWDRLEQFVDQNP